MANNIIKDFGGCFGGNNTGFFNKSWICYFSSSLFKGFTFAGSEGPASASAPCSGILEPEVKKYAEENDNIIFYGKLSYAETLSIENRCDILIAFYDPSVPNHKFAAPNKFYEALMLGKPLIMAENTGMSEVVKKNDIGSVVPYSSPEKGFMELLERKADWEKMSEREKKLYDELYSWNTMSERLVKLYQDLKNSSGR